MPNGGARFYVLSGHSCGACLAFQTVFQHPGHHGPGYLPDDLSRWPAASPAHFDPAEISARVREGRAPRLVVLDQSSEDQLVPMNQKERFGARLSEVSGLRVVEGHRCTGRHPPDTREGGAAGAGPPSSRASGQRRSPLVIPVGAGGRATRPMSAREANSSCLGTTRTL
jgi:hypothetical protein